MGQQVKKWIFGLAVAAALLSTSCASQALGATQFPDVDPSADVDYIGDAVSISNPPQPTDMAPAPDPFAPAANSSGS